MTKLMILRKPVTRFSLLGKEKTIILSNLLAGIIFFLTGIMILYLNSTGRLGMEETRGFTKIITDASGYVNQFVGGNVLLNILFFAVIIFLIYKITKKM